MSATPPNNLPFFLTVFFTATGGRLQITQFSDPHGRDAQLTIPRGVELRLDEMEAFLKNGPLRLDLKDDLTIPESLLEYPRQLGCETAAYVPVLQEGRLRGLVLIGARGDQIIDDDVVDAFARTIRLTTTSLVPSAIPTEPSDERRVLESQALNALLTAAASVKDMRSF